MIDNDNDDLHDLRTVTRDFLSAVNPHDAVERKGERTDRMLWERACSELGVAGIAVPEEHGGLGVGVAGLAVLCEEAARALAPLPVLSSVAVAQTALVRSALAPGGHPQVLADELPALLDGSRVAALADRDGPGAPATDPPTTAHPDGGRWRLGGEKWFVLDGLGADLLLVTATTAEGPALFAVDAASDGVTRTGVDAVDLTHDVARIELAGAPARLVAPASTWAAVVQEVALVRTVAVACLNLGGAERSLHDAVEYAKIRFQFGRAIGSFQAIKHRCADLATELDDARSAVAHAIWAADRSPADLPPAAAMAAVACSRSYLACSAENVQIHGGIGFTWEHPAHLHFRRARSLAGLFGDAREHREALLTALGV